MLPTSTPSELYSQGFSLRQIAAQAGITFQAVHDRLTKAGVKMRPRMGSPRKPKLYGPYVDKRRLWMFPHLGCLKIGESTIVTYTRRSRTWRQTLYDMALRRGIRISIQALTETEVRITRRA